MTDVSSVARQPQGCLGALVAVALVALLITLGLSPPMTPSIYVFVFPVVTIVFTVMGLPLYALAQRLGRANFWMALTAGAATGAAFPLLSALSTPSGEAWLGAAKYAALGAVGGTTFFLAATLVQTPRRNGVLLVVLTLATVAVMLLVRSVVRFL